MLWRGGAPSGVFGSLNELCAVNRARPSWRLRIVAVDVEHGLAHERRLALGLVARAQRVIEDHNAGGARDLLHQGFHLRVVHALELFGVEEVPDFRLVPDEFESGYV